MKILNRPDRLAAGLLALALLAGCGGAKEEAAPSSSRTEVSIAQSTQSQAPAQEATWQNYESKGNDLSLSHPSDWTVEEDGNIISISSGADLDSAMLFADITYEVSLFLAGHGDLETSIDALVDKYADVMAEGSVMNDYVYNWDTGANGNIVASSSFTFQLGGSGYEGMVVVDQIGGRVILIAYMRPHDDRASQADEIYNQIHGSVQLGGTDAPLQAANLSDLGFPEAPSGFYRFYSPVTGQFFIYPDSWDLVTSPHDDYVILYNDKGALMITENWTDSFYEIYNNNGNDEVECFDYFLDECAEVVEGLYEQSISYRDFEYLATENQELIKAAFNYTVGNRIGRCFAELGVRPYDGDDKIQATLCMYAPGDSYSIDLFSIIMDSTVIYYPDL